MRKLPLLAALLSASLTSACGTTTAIDGTTVHVCKTWEPIYLSKSDKLTDGTARQIAGNNAANEVWCGKRPPEKTPVKVAKAAP